jgi:LmbE family N-acetylglucosaminyl deacetylase
MITLSWMPREDESPASVLCLGSHSDDLEIGCGGMIMQLIADGVPIDVTWVVFSAAGRRGDEARASAETLLEGAAGRRLVFGDHRDGFFPYNGAAIKDEFERLKSEADPDLILTHYRHDLHQDHRLLCELTWNTFRDHAILEYEIPKYDGDLGAPNVFFPLRRETCERKVRGLMRHFGSQRDKRWFSEETFMGLMRLRGVECAAPDGMAEAFHGRKLRLGPPRL